MNTRPQSFSITGNTDSPVGSLVGAASCDKDWITIPCISDNSVDPTSNCQDRLCGDSFNAIESTTGGNVILFSEYYAYNDDLDKRVLSKYVSQLDLCSRFIFSFHLRSGLGIITHDSGPVGAHTKSHTKWSTRHHIIHIDTYTIYTA